MILRECSTSAEVRKSRVALFPSMVAQVKRMNDRIQHVDIEFCDGLARQHHLARGKKDRSFLILDEDVLKVAPVRRELAKAPSANGAFRGLGQGFLNSDRARRRGLADQRRQDQGSKNSGTSGDAEHNGSAPGDEPKAAADESEKHNSGDQTAGDTDSELIKSIKASERTRINSSSSSSGVPPGIETTLEERRRLVMGGTDTSVGKVPEDVMRSVRSAAGVAAAGSAAATVAPTVGVATSSVNAVESAAAAASTSDPAASAVEDDEEANTDEQPPSLSDLANRLFGNELELDIGVFDEAASDGGAGHLTESTKTPSPKASSRGGGAPSERSERSEPVTEDGADIAGNAEAPAAGIRWLQHRRKERGSTAASSGGATDAGSSQQAAASSSSQKDESDDLVSLWMKQRW